MIARSLSRGHIRFAVSFPMRITGAWGGGWPIGAKTVRSTTLIVFVSV